ncbi:TPA_asm: phage tail protein, partial [Salmonella enterica subsp. diarizonae]|nr:phage tail protein [Salmonella enterica subsp. diarizonae]
WKRTIMYYAVRLFGKGMYNRKTPANKAGVS